MNSAIKVEVEPNKILTEQELKEAQNTSNILIELVCWELVHLLHSLNLRSFDFSITEAITSTDLQ